MTDEHIRDPSPPSHDAAQKTPSSRKLTPPVVSGDTRNVPDQGHDIFFAAVQTTRMPMTVTDPRKPDNPIVFANQAFLAMTGYKSEEIIGRNCRFLQGPETDQATVSELRKAIEEQREFATEILNYRKDGYTFWNALYVSPIYDEHGELTYFFGSQLDVSRRREAEDQLRQAQKMEALGRLTGGIAHDFNNLLQVMVGYLELMDSAIAKPDLDRGKLSRSIANSRTAADRATQLTQQLLAFARKQRLDGRTLSLNAVIKRLMDLADRTLGADVALDLRLEHDLPGCRVDPSQVETALLNILINARDAMMDAPEKRLTIETRSIEVRTNEMAKFDNLAPGRYVAASVQDTGTGMPRHVVERVMDPFFTTKEEGKGTGLGLSMVYGFTKQSGGVVRIDSTDGVGTKVTIFFPAVDEQVAEAPRPSGQALDRPGNETILIVEDRLDVAELARTILKDYGYTTLMARTGREALDIVEDGKPIDLLFTDLIMPGELNGVMLAREAKRRRPHLKILLTTGYSEASIERTDAGGLEFDVLNKPYGRSDLARKVRIVLDGPTGVS